MSLLIQKFFSLFTGRGGVIYNNMSVICDKMSILNTINDRYITINNTLMGPGPGPKSPLINYLKYLRFSSLR